MYELGAPVLSGHETLESTQTPTQSCQRAADGSRNQYKLPGFVLGEVQTTVCQYMMYCAAGVSSSAKTMPASIGARLQLSSVLCAGVALLRTLAQVVAGCSGSTRTCHTCRPPTLRTFETLTRICSSCSRTDCRKQLAWRVEHTVIALVPGEVVHLR